MKNLELVYLAVAYGMAGIMLYTSRNSPFPTLSHIALYGKLTRQVFFWGLSISAVLFAVLMYEWMIPYFSLGLGIKILVGTLVACQILTGFFPVEGAKSKNVHLFFGNGLGACMFILIVALASTAAVDEVVRLANGLFAFGMVILLATVRRRVKKGEYLLHEKWFFGLWHAAIFITVYFG